MTLMLFKKINIFCYIGILVLTGTCLGLEKDEGSALLLTLTVAEPIVKSGQSISLTLSVRNISKQPVSLPYSPFLQQFLETRIVDKTDHVVLLKHPVYAFGFGKSPVRSLGPGEVWQYPLYDAGSYSSQSKTELGYLGPVFLKPGKYVVKTILKHDQDDPEMIFSFWTGETKSNDVAVEVK